MPKRGKTRQVKHHAALSFVETKELFARLADAPGEAARALRFLMLTAARTGEVLGASWNEIDLERAIWDIPASRMKAGKPHRVPLTDAALAVIPAQAAKLPPQGRPVSGLGEGLRNANPLFPGPRGRQLSNMAMPMLLRRLGVDATVHGSTFRDWAATETNFSREVAEACLAHTLGAVERAYRRDDLLDKRRKLMELWATVLTI